MLSIVLNIWTWFLDQMIGFGYAGMFAFSFAGSFILFMPTPYFIPVALLSSDIRFDPTLVAFASALGSTAAKTAIFRASYVGRRFLEPRTLERIRPFERLVSRYGWLAAFIAAATPMPDDIVFIPLGFTRYSLFKFIGSTLAGKMILAMLIAWGARFYTSWIRLLIEETSDPFMAALLTVGFFSIAVIVVYSIVKLDWAKLLGRWFPWTLDSEEKG